MACNEHDAHKGLKDSRDHNTWGFPTPIKKPWSQTLTTAAILTAAIMVCCVFGQWLAEWLWK